MSTNAKTKHPTHGLVFKKQAAQLLNTSGRPLAQFARELGLPGWKLRDWKRSLQPQLAQQPENIEAMRLRLAELERENLHPRQQRDITYVRAALGWLYLALVMDLWEPPDRRPAMAGHSRGEPVMGAPRSRYARGS